MANDMQHGEFRFIRFDEKQRVRISAFEGTSRTFASWRELLTYIEERLLPWLDEKKQACKIMGQAFADGEKGLRLQWLHEAMDYITSKVAAEEASVEDIPEAA